MCYRIALLCASMLVVILGGCSARPVPDAALKQYLQGEDFYVRGSVEAAHAVFARVAKAFPQFYQARFMEGKTLYLLGSSKDAERVLAELLRKEPRYHEAAVWLARVEVQQGETAAAEKLLSQLLSYDSQDARLLYLMGLVRSDQGNLQEAITYLQKAGATEEELAQVHIELGGLYYRFSLDDRAKTELMHALALLPAASPLRKSVADLLLKVEGKE